ncbi:MAG: ATP-binding protein [Planctomycetota bacterium]|nr:ATP-binding protein [Planctomycetota bacterium]
MSTLRVLIVEDNEADAHLLEELLRSGRAADVRVVETLTDALEAVRGADAPDVVLVDLYLPDSEGTQTVTALAEAAPDVAVVALSSGPHESTGLESLRCGAQDYLMKGRLDADLLSRAVRNSLDWTRHRTMLRRRAEQEELARRSAGLTWWELELATGAVRHSGDFGAIFGMPALDGLATHAAMMEHVAPEDREATRVALERATRRDGDVSHDFRFVRADGSRVWATAASRGVRRADGTLTHLIGVTRNTDVAKRRELALRELAEGASTGESFFESLTLHLVRAMRTRWALIAERVEGGRLRTVALCERERVLETLEYDLRGTPCERVIHAGDVCVFPSGAREAFPEDAVLAQLGADSYAGAAMISSRGEVLGLVAVLDDRPLPAECSQLLVLVQVFASRAAAELERVRAEEALRRREEMARQADRMEAIGRLASGVAHDFNNLLTAIRAYASLATATLPAEHPARESLSQVENAARQATGVTNSLLSFARGSRSGTARACVGPMVASAARLFRRMAPADLRLEVETTEADAVWIDAQESHIEQVVINLLMNAADASAPGGRVRLEAGRARSGEAMIRVQDWGSGMSPQVRARIFEPFFTTKPEGKGTGLGLPTARRVIEEHGGRLELETAPGKGASFTVYLPSRPAPETASAQEPESQVGLGAGRRAMVVEENAMVRGLLASMLEALGFEVTVSGSMPTGAEGGADLIVSGPGPEAWRGAGREPGAPGVRWVFVTEQERREGDREDAVSGVARVRKPFKLSDLRAAIEATGASGR